MRIELEVSELNECTDSPWWILVDPGYIRQMFEGVLFNGEIPDDDRILTAIASSIEGPYFSRKEAEDYLKSRRYAYSSSAAVWCSSGYRASQYKNAIRLAKSQQPSPQATEKEE